MSDLKNEIEEVLSDLKRISDGLKSDILRFKRIEKESRRLKKALESAIEHEIDADATRKLIGQINTNIQLSNSKTNQGIIKLKEAELQNTLESIEMLKSCRDNQNILKAFEELGRYDVEKAND